jgi:hypothetical protein
MSERKRYSGCEDIRGKHPAIYAKSPQARHHRGHCRAYRRGIKSGEEHPYHYSYSDKNTPGLRKPLGVNIPLCLSFFPLCGFLSHLFDKKQGGCKTRPCYYCKQLGARHTVPLRYCFTARYKLYSNWTIN